MSVDLVRAVCLALPGTTETVQWGNDLVLKVGGKMFAVSCLEPHELAVSFKVTPEQFDELVELPGFRPAPYLARAKWVSLESFDAVTPAELKQYLENSYTLVRDSLPKKVRAAL